MRTSWRRSHPTMGFDHPTRRLLEQAGWRTMLDYRENHIRHEDGTLIEVLPRWTAEAEWCGGRRVVATATAASIDDAWTELQSAIDSSDVTATLVA